MLRKTTRTTTRKRGPKRKATTRSKPNKGKKAFFYVLGFAAAGGAIYLAKENIRQHKNSSIVINNDFNPSATSTGRSKANNSFPLKKGSKGSKVTELQKALAKIIGEGAMNKNGGVDGSFGPGTESALKQAGLPVVVDEDTFNTVTGKQQLRIVFDPKGIADELYKQAREGNADEVLKVLKQIRSVDDYSAVNNYYKKLAFISKTIVTDLLEYAFKEREGVKEQLKAEFRRIGLKNESGPKWTLSGFRLFNDIVTLRDTYVEDLQKNKILVKKNVILGDEIKSSNGMTYFKALDNSICAVPTEDVRDY